MKAKKIVAIIPARMASTRFPGKPLAGILGIPMIEHVRRRVSLCGMLSAVFVATCDREIKEVVEEAGGNVIMTSDSHQRCTDRVAEAARNLDADIVVNIQGDEPLITPKMIAKLAEPMLKDDKCECVNLIAPITDDKEFENPNAVKTVVGINGNVLYFSREPIPSGKKTKENYKKYKQLGIIGFTRPLLLKYSRLQETPLEKIESIDMMRFIENGYAVRTVLISEPLYGVDTPEDLKKVESIMARDKLLPEYAGIRAKNG